MKNKFIFIIGVLILITVMVGCSSKPVSNMSVLYPEPTIDKKYKLIAFENFKDSNYPWVEELEGRIAKELSKNDWKVAKNKSDANLILKLSYIAENGPRSGVIFIYNRTTRANLPNGIAFTDDEKVPEQALTVFSSLKTLD